MKNVLRSTFGILVVAAFLALTPPTYAKGGHGGHRGQGRHGTYHVRQGGHFNSASARGGHKFSRGGPKISRGKSVAYRNWSARKWSGDVWGGRNWGGSYWGGSRSIFIGGFGYPYYWGWSPYWGWNYPYTYSYFSYYPHWYYPSYAYYYDDCSASRRRFY